MGPFEQIWNLIYQVYRVSISRLVTTIYKNLQAQQLQQHLIFHAADSDANSCIFCQYETTVVSARLQHKHQDSEEDYN